MARSYLDDEDDIAAPASASGGAIATVRASGPTCLSRFAPLFSRASALEESGRAARGWLISPVDGSRVDEVLATAWRGGAGYTGEEAVELGCHGSAAVVRAVMRAMRDAGFKDALPGEFTFRAFRNGKLDLARARAVEELARARTDSARSLALERLAGSVSRRAKEARELAAAALAAVELSLDYAEDDGEDVPFPREAAEGALRAVESMLAGHCSARVREDGARVALLGRTNAGKSSLFNALLRAERAIVSDEHGTTRDFLESWCDMAGVPVLLVDTAGFRPEASGRVESEGQLRAWRVADEAVLALYVVDGAEGIAEADEEWLSARPHALRVWNKVDDARARVVPEGWIAASAIAEGGTRHLVEAVVAALGADGAGASGAVASEDQRATLEDAREALADALAGHEAGVPRDALAPDLRTAVAALDELLGEGASFDALEEIFSRFCVGK